MGLRLLWQPAIAVIVTHDDCVVVFFWQINSLSLSLLRMTVTRACNDYPSIRECIGVTQCH